jgi:transcriptional regulator with XRE-family HTH domain
MKSAGLTQAQLARQSGVGDAVISRWLNEESQPTIEKLRPLVVPLGVPLLELMVAAGRMEPEEARMKDRPAPPKPVRHGVSTEGLDPDQERELENYAAYLRGQNPKAR